MTAEPIRELRDALVVLHRSLLDHERRQFEKAFGRIPGNGAFLQLVLHNAWFSWLLPLSGLVARLDARMAEPEPVTEEEAAGFLDEVRAFVTQRRYEGVLQESAELVVAHGALAGVLAASVETK